MRMTPNSAVGREEKAYCFFLCMAWLYTCLLKNLGHCIAFFCMCVTQSSQFYWVYWKGLMTFLKVRYQILNLSLTCGRGRLGGPEVPVRQWTEKELAVGRCDLLGPIWMGSPGHFSCESKEPGPYQLLGREVKGLFLDCTYEQPAGILAQKITDVLPV